MDEKSQDPSIQAAALYSPDPQAKYRQLANMAFLGAKFDSSIDSTTYPLARDLYARQNFGVPQTSDDEFFSRVGEEFRQQDAVDAAQKEFQSKAALAALDQPSGGQAATPEAFIRGFLSDHPALANAPDRQAILGTMAKNYQAESDWAAKNGWLVHGIFDAARDPENNGGTKATQAAVLAGILKRTAPENQRKVLDLTAAYAEVHPETKSYAGQLIDQAHMGTTQTVNAMDRLRQEHALESERRHLQAQLRNGGAPSLGDSALAGGLALARGGLSGAADELMRPNLPLEKIPARLKEIDDDLAQIQAERQINLFLDDRVNSNSQKGDGVGSLVRQAGIDTADQTHLMLLGALGPAGEAGMIEAMTARGADRLKGEYPRMNSEVAHAMAGGMAVGQFLATKLEALKILNKFPVTKRLLERVGKLSWWKQLAVHEGINLLGATATNEASLLMDSFGRELASAITGDIQNGEQPGSFVETQKHVATLSGILGLSGIGGRITRSTARALGPRISQAIKGILTRALAHLTKNLRGEASSNEPKPSQETNSRVQKNIITYSDKNDHSKEESPPEKVLRTAKYKIELELYPAVSPPLRSKYLADAIDLSKLDAPTKLVFERILPAVDHVIDTNGFPYLPIDHIVSEDEYGNFERERWIKDGKPVLDVPKKIGIRSDGPWPHLTGLHEIGHPIDLKLLSEDGLEFASVVSPKLEAFRRVVDGSPTIKRLRADDNIDPQYSTYHEIFARAFAQYVALRTDDKILLREIEKVRADSDERFKVWGDPEFLPIAAELDRIFRTEGLK